MHALQGSRNEKSSLFFLTYATSKTSPCDPGMAIATFDWLDVARNSAVNALLTPYVLEQQPHTNRPKRIKGSKGKEEDDDDDDDDDDYPEFVPDEEDNNNDDAGFKRVHPQTVKRHNNDGGRKRLKISLRKEQSKHRKK